MRAEKVAEIEIGQIILNHSLRLNQVGARIAWFRFVKREGDNCFTR